MGCHSTDKYLHVQLLHALLCTLSSVGTSRGCQGLCMQMCSLKNEGCFGKVFSTGFPTWLLQFPHVFNPSRNCVINKLYCRNEAEVSRLPNLPCVRALSSKPGLCCHRKGAIYKWE